MKKKVIRQLGVFILTASLVLAPVTPVEANSNLQLGKSTNSTVTIKNPFGTAGLKTNKTNDTNKTSSTSSNSKTNSNSTTNSSSTNKTNSSTTNKNTTNEPKTDSSKTTTTNNTSATTGNKTSTPAKTNSTNKTEATADKADTTAANTANSQATIKADSDAAENKKAPAADNTPAAPAKKPEAVKPQPVYNAEQIKSFSPDQVKLITPEQIATLTAKELAAFSVEQRAALSQEQTAAVNAEEWAKVAAMVSKAQADAEAQVKAQADAAQAQADAAAKAAADAQAKAQADALAKAQANAAKAQAAAAPTMPAAQVTPGRFHKVNVLGDSIAYGVGTSDPSHSFPSVLGQLLGASVNNYGTSCSRITDIVSDISNPGSFVDRMYGMDRSADLVVVSGATNDFWYGDCPIGRPTDSQPNTFYGAMNTMFNYLKGAYPHALIVFVIPQRQGKGGSLTKGPDRTTYGNFGTGSLNDYRKAIMDRCQAHNIPMLDEYMDPKFNLADDRDALLKYGSSAADGCHLNDAGAAYFAGRIRDFVMSYNPATYFPAYCIYDKMDVPTAALPAMLGPTGFVMPNGSVLPYHPAAIPTAKSSVRDCYLAFHAAQYSR